jgi:hypothetical protein
VTEWWSGSRPRPSVRGRLDITQPGTANAPAVGKGASFVQLPYQVSCGSGKATVQVAGKAKARKITSVTFKAGGKKVAAVKKVRARQGIKLKKITSSATSIKAGREAQGRRQGQGHPRLQRLPLIRRTAAAPARG